uniref:Uncharacterized protein n=1 Tax=Arundo donax TaxID=35708 RepID=A0A0A9ATY5_ARUDO
MPCKSGDDAPFAGVNDGSERITFGLAMLNEDLLCFRANREEDEDELVLPATAGWLYSPTPPSSMIWNASLTTSSPPLAFPASGNAMSHCRTRSPCWLFSVDSFTRRLKSTALRPKSSSGASTAIADIRNGRGSNLSGLPVAPPPLQ